MKTVSVFPVRASLLRAFALLVVSALLPVTPAHALDITVAPGGDIQSAIDQVNAAGGGNVILQAGTHTAVTTLWMRNNVTLKGAGAASTILQNTGGTAEYSLISGVSPGVDSITVRDVAIDGRLSTNGIALMFDGADNANTNFNFTNIEVRNWNGMGLHPMGVNGLTQVNNYVHDNGTGMGHNEYARRVSNVNVTGCRFDYSFVGDGIKLTYFNGAYVSNCTATGNLDRGFRNQETNFNGSYTYNTTMSNGSDGMELEATNLTVDHNAAYYNGTNTATTHRNGFSVTGGSGTFTNNNAYGNYWDFAVKGDFGVFETSGNTVLPPSFPVIQAESYSSMFGVTVGTCSDTGGGQNLGSINNNDWAAYNSINLTGVTGVDARVSCGNSAGGTIEVHLDAVTGPLVGTVTVSGTGGWQNWTTKTGVIAGASGIRTVYLVFKGTSNPCNLNWIQFK